MTSAEIREAFLQYFQRYGHTRVASSSLVPDDPTLLFTNAGMVQFKDAFLGLEDRPYSRATTAQKCMRVSGKHNDLKNVGPSPTHHTFFEMLGNFSFGDYFKSEACRFAYELVTEVYGIPLDRLFFTVHREDDQAYRIWVDEIGIPSERIAKLGDKDNFWEMADTGPCGYTSELHVDIMPEKGVPSPEDLVLHIEENPENRTVEIWNLVFMQFNQKADGTRDPLPSTGVDTGMGLERMAVILQDVESTYETDVFLPILNRIQALLDHTDKRRDEEYIGYRVIADHARAMTFLIADGVLPGNEERNYVLRMIMRRAMRFGKKLDFTGRFLGDVCQAVIDHMGHHYTELRGRQDFILEVIAQEEDRFQRTLDTGLARLRDLMEKLEEEDGKEIPGREVFRLYDTYGFPLDLTRDEAEEHEFVVDEAGFEQAMAEQRERARAATRFEAGQQADFYRELRLPATEFVGYESVESSSEVLALVRDGEALNEARGGEMVEIVLTETPFYAEAGGQVGDKGILEGPQGRVRVEDTQRPIPGVIVHYGHVVEGRMEQGEIVAASVDADRRLDVMRNHTATHLLHRALRDTLGEHAQQQGSLVAPDRLRFDFSHLSPLSRDELEVIESQVNQKIREDLSVRPAYMSFDEAMEGGATALFGEKYRDVVRVISINGYSKELCGGTHLNRTGEIGFCHVTSESSVGSGVRRVEAVTGRGAEDYVHRQLARLDHVAAELGTDRQRIEERLESLLGELKMKERALDRLQREIARQEVDRLLSEVQEVNGVKVVSAEVEALGMDRLREMGDWVRDRLDSGVIVLGSVMDGRPGFVTIVTQDLVEKGFHAGRIAGEVARVTGGGGGGRPTLAQAGGNDATKLREALSQVPSFVRNAK